MSTEIAKEHMAHHVAQAKQLSPDDLNDMINQFETKWKLNTKTYDAADPLNIGFELFFEGDPKDPMGFPIEIDLQRLATQHQMKQKILVEIYHRCNELDIIHNSSQDINGLEITMANRLNRIMNAADDAYEIVFRYGRSKERILNPTVIPITPENDHGLFRSSTMDLSELTAYQELILSLLDELYKNNYKRYKGSCYREVITPQKFHTKSWQCVEEVSQFISRFCNKESQFDNWKRLTHRTSHWRDATNHLTDCFDAQFPEIEKSRTTWSFKNGILLSGLRDKMDKPYTQFIPYEDEAFKKLPLTLVSAKYFDDELSTYESDWRDIPTPNIDSILDYQNFEEDVKEWIFVLLGRLCHDTGTFDGWQVIPFLKGMAGTGKSTIIKDICKQIYEPSDIPVLSNNIQQQFGLESLMNGFMYVAPEIKGDFQICQADFQSMVSGEDVAVARKNKIAKDIKWTSPGIMAGNEVPNFKDNSGSITRRLVTLEFARMVKDADHDLPKRLQKETPDILLKSLRAYDEFAGKWGNVDIWNKLPLYFRHIRDQVAASTNPLKCFLTSENIKMEANSFIPLSLFQQHFNVFCASKNLGKHKFQRDFYHGPFSAHDLVVKKTTRVYNGQTCANKDIIFGVDVSEDVSEFSRDECLINEM